MHPWFSPAVEADFISSKVEILIRKQTGYLRVELVEKCPRGVQGRVDGAIPGMMKELVSCV